MDDKFKHAVEDITLRAALTRIARKADIMRLDAQRGSPARADAEEIALQAGIAMRAAVSMERELTQLKKDPMGWLLDHGKGE